MVIWKRVRIKPDRPKISKEALKRFRFFDVKHKSARVNIRNYEEQLNTLARDIYMFIKLFRESPELVDFVAKLRLLLHDNSTKPAAYRFASTFLDRIRLLDAFYEFHEDRGLPVRDQREHLLKELRTEVKIVIRFLKNSVKT